MKFRGALATEVGALRTELHQEVGALRAELHQEVGGLRADLHRELALVHRGLADVQRNLFLGLLTAQTALAALIIALG